MVDEQLFERCVRGHLPVTLPVLFRLWDMWRCPNTAGKSLAVLSAAKVGAQPPSFVAVNLLKGRAGL